MSTRFIAIALFFAITISTLNTVDPTHASLPKPFISTQDPGLARDWFDTTVNNGAFPFSFDYDGQPSSSFLQSWKQAIHSRDLDSNRTQEEYTFTDPKTRLKVRWVVIRYSDFPAVEWTCHFTNEGRSDTPIISNAQALDWQIRSNELGDSTLHYSTGSRAAADDYAPQVANLTAGTDLPLSGASGWLTTEVLSYFNLLTPDTNALIGIGWPGNWKARFTRDTGNGLHILAGQGLTHFVLHPGEEARTPLIALVFYKGDWITGQNLWRRWMLAHNLPRVKGKLPAPIIGSAAKEIDNLHYNTTNEISEMDQIRADKLPCDWWWIDAGWYPSKSIWTKTGTWDEDPSQFPNGIRQVSDHARSLGMKQILWFEPERVTSGSALEKEHPEWLIYRQGNDNQLFNLGIPAARKFLTDLISDRITKFGVDLYRQDFNFDPLPYWQSQDTPDRQGMTEIKYIEGFLQFWDDLRAYHHGMFIDCCAAGGRRNDLEILRRAVPLLQSDYRWEPNGTQANNYGAALWMPYHGTGGPNVFTTYMWRSFMGPSHGYVPDRTDPNSVSLIKAMAEQEQLIQPFFFGDFYPLTPWSLDNSAWMSWQYDRPDMAQGIVQAFRRPGNFDPTQTFKLCGLDPNSQYRFHDFDSNGDTVYSGSDLMVKGLSITLTDEPQSALLLYTKLSKP